MQSPICSNSFEFQISFKEQKVILCILYERRHVSSNSGLPVGRRDAPLTPRRYDVKTTRLIVFEQVKGNPVFSVHKRVFIASIKGKTCIHVDVIVLYFLMFLNGDSRENTFLLIQEVSGQLSRRSLLFCVFCFEDIQIACTMMLTAIWCIYKKSLF